MKVNSAHNSAQRLHLTTTGPLERVISILVPSFAFIEPLSSTMKNDFHTFFVSLSILFAKPLGQLWDSKNSIPRSMCCCVRRLCCAAFTYTGTFPCASTPTGTACTVGKFDLCWLFGKKAMLFDILLWWLLFSRFAWFLGNLLPKYICACVSYNQRELLRGGVCVYVCGDVCACCKIIIILCVCCCCVLLCV